MTDVGRPRATVARLLFLHTICRTMQRERFLSRNKQTKTRVDFLLVSFVPRCVPHSVAKFYQAHTEAVVKLNEFYRAKYFVHPVKYQNTLKQTYGVVERFLVVSPRVANVPSVELKH